MSEPVNTPPAAQDPPVRYSAGQIAMIVFGIIFLLPGACSLFFVIGMMPEFSRKSFSDPIAQLIFMLWGVCFAISAVGIVLIVMARKRARRPR
jgi:hypothetical protein